MSQTRNTFTESGTFLINTGGQGVGPDGLALLFTETGTQSMVLKVNTAPPGATPSYTNIAYLNGSLALQSAGTAITASGLAYVSAEYAALDLYGTLTATSGSLVVQVGPADLNDVKATTFVQGAGQDFAFGGFPGKTRISRNSAESVDVVGESNGYAAITTDGYNLNGLPGAVTTGAKFLKAVASIPNNTATALATVTVPNTAATAVIRLTVSGSLGAGGAIGAGEASASNSYNLTIVRTAGVNAVGTMSSAFGAAAAAVAGAATCTSTLALSSVTGAVGAENTFTINGTIARSGGSSANHTARLLIEVINANDGGVTVA